MAKVKWLPEALDDIERLYTFLKDKDQEAAARAASCILEGARLLKRSPRVGRPMPDETGRRELFIAFGAAAYVLRYMLEAADVVVVIRIWHSRENKRPEAQA
jgi:plasmid stabilization system protein ParE